MFNIYKNIVYLSLVSLLPITLSACDQHAEVLKDINDFTVNTTPKQVATAVKKLLSYGAYGAVVWPLSKPQVIAKFATLKTESEELKKDYNSQITSEKVSKFAAKTFGITTGVMALVYLPLLIHDRFTIHDMHKEIPTFDSTVVTGLKESIIAGVIYGSIVALSGSIAKIAYDWYCTHYYAKKSELFEKSESLITETEYHRKYVQWTEEQKSAFADIVAPKSSFDMAKQKAAGYFTAFKNRFWSTK